VRHGDETVRGLLDTDNLTDARDNVRRGIIDAARAEASTGDG
jgi:hypothetical protein